MCLHAHRGRPKTFEDVHRNALGRACLLVLLFDGTTLEMARKLRKESPAGCAGEGKQSKGY